MRWKVVMLGRRPESGRSAKAERTKTWDWRVRGRKGWWCRGAWVQRGENMKGLLKLPCKFGWPAGNVLPQVSFKYDRELDEGLLIVECRVGNLWATVGQFWLQGHSEWVAIQVSLFQLDKLPCAGLDQNHCRQLAKKGRHALEKWLLLCVISSEQSLSQTVAVNVGLM